MPGPTALQVEPASHGQGHPCHDRQLGLTLEVPRDFVPSLWASLPASGLPHSRAPHSPSGCEHDPTSARGGASSSPPTAPHPPRPPRWCPNTSRMLSPQKLLLECSRRPSVGASFRGFTQRPLCQLAGAAVTGYHRLGGLNRNFGSHGSRSLTSRCRRQDWFLLRPPSLRNLPCPPCPPVVAPLCVSVS